MTELVEITDADGVRTVRMNRPDKKNALTGVMYCAMAEAIENASDDDSIGAVLIAGVPGAFSAGNDMKDFMAAASGTGTLSNDIMRLLHALPRSEKPLVAAVQGLAIGIGTTMLFHCDYVVVGEDARLATPFISLGILPEAGSTLMGPRQIGYQRAFALLAMGRPLDAKGAKEAGIANEVVPPNEVDAAALKAAREIAALPREAMAIARHLMRPSAEEAVARIDREAAMFRDRLRSPEAQNAFAAFLNRAR
ncbi:4-chlorobenzoyl coenzyme A dehalogenase-1 [Variibacter gotjawalensis]|uniref:4-chlorobenzoyl coenzyme A dehalogenase-1 n=1 Tax=Variibacter gotjawalensis TaxID=1333996 RepID=A0A0S3PQY0_9BRAD|nr:crotonase/enoyl-CoA hydratase family protein [Variibacter gotjawalensis]NIK48675.1 enoyl-CoA hydratase/carnithine racemase [Variibacter gotjawalensis]RZS50536.1 enoyl-CoA hydratase [Variibacter gotjawalensis]BAT58370.1 4-chlorobenzoyl coenzyme A dehalogenase-1 [Variibacter gotjawalensis]